MEHAEDNLRHDQARLDLVLAGTDSSQPPPEGCDLASLHSRLRVLDNALFDKDNVPSEEDAAYMKEHISILRQIITIISRPSLRRLHINELPDEMLVQIFEHVEDWEMSETSFSSDAEGARDIQNARLVCKRFRNTCSHLLVRSVTVKITEESLSHLKAVTTHPLISKGIQRILVMLDYYDAELSNNITKFAHHSGALISDQQTSDGEQLYDSCWCCKLYGLSEVFRQLEYQFLIDLFTKPSVDFGEESDRSEEASDSYGKATDDTKQGCPSDCEEVHFPDVHPIQATLIRAHGIYRERYENQSRILKKGRFVAEITAAFARVPHVHMLHISDRRKSDPTFYTSFPYNYDLVEHDESEWLRNLNALCEGLILPHCWDIPRLENTDILPPMELLVQIPAALGKAGINVTSLHITLPLLDTISQMVPTAQESHDINSLARKLLHFRFGTYVEYRASGGLEWSPVEDFLKFFNPFLETPTMQWLDLRTVFFLGIDELPTPNVFALPDPRAITEGTYACPRA